MLFSFRQKAEEASANLPPLLPRAEKIALNVLQGHHARRKSGTGEKFWQFREYTHDDRIQDIDWRQSAKTQRVYIRQKERTTLQKNLFWCSSSSSMHFKSEDNLLTKHEAAAILTLSLAVMLAHSGEYVGMLHGSRPSHTEKTLREIEYFLRDNNNPEELPLMNVLGIAKNAGLVLAGDFLSTVNEIETMMRTLGASTRNGLMIQILDPAEIKLPYHGRVLFKNPNGQDNIDIDHAASIRTAYQQRIDDHQKSLKNACDKTGWKYILHVTDQPLHDTLFKIWTLWSRA